MVNRKSVTFLDEIREKDFPLNHRLRVAEYNQLSKGVDPFANLRIAKEIKKFAELMLFLAIVHFIAAIVASQNGAQFFSHLSLNSSLLCCALFVFIAFVKRTFQNRFNDFAARLTRLKVLLGLSSVSAMLRTETTVLEDLASKALIRLARALLENDFRQDCMDRFYEAMELFKYFGLVASTDTHRDYIHLAQEAAEAAKDAPKAYLTTEVPQTTEIHQASAL